MQAPCEKPSNSDVQSHTALVRKKPVLNIHSFFVILVLMFVFTFLIVIGMDFFGGWESLQGNFQPYLCPSNSQQLSICFKS